MLAGSPSAGPGPTPASCGTAARRGAADRRHRRRQRRGAARRARDWSRPAGAGRWWWPATSRRRPRWSGSCAGECRTCSPTTWCPRIGVLAPESARARDPRDVPRPRDRRQAPQRRAPTSWRWSRGATPGRRAHRGRAAGPRPRRRAARRRRRGRRRRRRRHHRRAQRRRARPRGRRPGPRGGRDHAGDPDRRGRPRHALVGGHDGRGGRAGPRRRPAPSAAARRQADPGFLPDRRRRAPTTTRRSRPRPSGSPCGVTPAGRGSWSSPEGRVVERTGKDLREVDLLVGSGGVLRNGRPGVAERVLAGSTGATSRAAGSCRGRRAWWSTTTTCSPRRACSRERASGGGVPAGPAALPGSLLCSLSSVDIERRPRLPPARRRVGTCDRLRQRGRGAAGRRGSPTSWRAPVGADPRRAAQRAAAPVVAGPSNFRRAQVPWGLDLAAAWALAVPGHRAAGYVILAAARLLRGRHPAAGHRAADRCAGRRRSSAALVAIGLPRGLGEPGSWCSAASALVGLLLTFAGQQVANGAHDLADQVVNGLERDPGLAAGRPAQRQRLADQRLDQAGPGRDHRAHQRRRGRSARSPRSAPRSGTCVAGLLHHPVLDLLLPRRRRPDLGLAGAAGAARRPRARSTRSGRVAWVSLTQFVRATVIVALVDAIGIMIVAAVLGVPFVLAIGVLVFLGAFVPMVGATVAGTVAVLVALVDQGPITALLMLGGVILVQQIEGHILQPFLMGRFVSLHPLGVIVAIGVRRPGGRHRRCADRRAAGGGRQRRRPAPRAAASGRARRGRRCPRSPTTRRSPRTSTTTGAEERGRE